MTSSMSKFCPDQFWNASLTWNTDNPRLSECFRNTVLVLIPACAALILFPIKVSSLVREARRRGTSQTLSRFSKFFWAKQILLAFIAVNVIVTFASNSPGHSSRTEFYYSDWTFLVGYLFIVLASGLILLYEQKAHFPTSGYQFTVWLLTTICGLPTFKQHVEDVVNYSNALDYVDIFKALLMPLIIAELILHCCSDLGLYDVRHLAPESCASVVSFLTFQWMFPLIYRGYRATLSRDDLPRNPEFLEPDNNDRTFSKVWNKEKAKTGQPSLLKVLFHIHKGRLLYATAIASLRACLAFVNPALLCLLIRHLQSDTEEAWKGVLYAVLLFINAFLCTFAFTHYVRDLTIIAIQMRNALATAVFKKSLKLSPTATKSFGMGEITNYISVDCQLILDCVPYATHLFIDPLLVLLTLFFLYEELGVAALSGLAVLLLLAPINVWGNRLIGSYETKILACKDERMKATNEALSGIQVVKLHAWELPFMKHINGYRDKEVRHLRGMAKLLAFSNCIFSCSPVIVTAVVFGIYILINPVNHVLDAEKIFVSLSLFSILRLPLELFPIVLFDNIRIGVCLKRISQFLNADELDKAAVEQAMEDTGEAVHINPQSSYTWDPETPFKLKLNDGFRVDQGGFIAVIGKVGGGKTSLLSAILGDMIALQGGCRLQGSVSYVPQQPWVLNDTLKENVLFGSQDSSYYNRVMKACALDDDLQALPNGDLTEIGENGVNLSGGQKQRVSLARAVFSDKEILLLDDPLSAVDLQVSQHIFQKVLSSKTGLLRGKTRIWVTHNLSFLDQVDEIVIISEGKIAQRGTYQELICHPGVFSDLLRERENLSKQSEGEDLPEIPKGNKEALVRQISESEQQDLGRLIEEEAVMEGRVGWKVYRSYMQTLGMSGAIGIIILFAVGQALHVSSTAWLSVWANENNGTNKDPKLYLGIFGGIGLFEIIVAYSRQVGLFLACFKASKVLHDKMLYHIFHAPMSFFDSTPIGRITNRFSSDLDTVDENLPGQITDFLWCMTEMISTVIIISAVIPPFLFVVAGLFCIFCFFVVFYIGASRQLKRFESTSKSPILSQIQECYVGASSIRAYKAKHRFGRKILAFLNENVQCHYLVACSEFWLSAVTEAIAAVIIFSTALIIVSMKGSVSAGFAGLAMMYSFEILEALTWQVHMACRIETDIVCIERIMEYFDVPQEAEWERDDEVCPPDWPRNGAVTFESFSARYREGLDLSVRNLSLAIEERSRIGICGRTGAGKTTMVKSLFRVIEAAHGRILIDGVDISSLSLHTLRKAIAIIPQDPTLFSGSVRFNLDPFGEHSDPELWRSLELAHLKDHLTDQGLEHPVEERGSNFSLGQRQLLCLARALLRRTQILVLDEATASVDVGTDSLIQSAISKNFQNCTVLTVAHRLNTIRDCDNVLVMKNGQKMLFAPPERVFGKEQDLMEFNEDI